MVAEEKMSRVRMRPPRKSRERGRATAIAFCTARRLIALIAAYLLGWFGWSVAWLLVVVTVIVVLKDRSIQRKIRLRAAQDREMLLLKESLNEKVSVDPLQESAEWLNKVIERLWPHFLQHVKTNVREEVQTNIRDTLSKFKLGGNFHFKSIDIGPKPPRLDCVEVLNKSPPGEIAICTDIVYASHCDVVFIWRGIKGALKDFKVQARAQLVLRPLIDTIPFIAGYQLVFLEKPVVQYKLSGVGKFLDFPGLREKIHKIIVKRITNLMTGGNASDTGSTAAYEMLTESFVPEDNGDNIKTVASDSTFLYDHLVHESEIPLQITSKFVMPKEEEGSISQTEDGAPEPLSTPEAKRRLWSTENASDQMQMADFTDIKTSAPEVTDHSSMSDMETGDLSPIINNDQLSISSILTNNQISVSGDTLVSDDTLVSGDQVIVSGEQSSMPDEIQRISSVSSELGHYNPIPKPTRRITTSVADEEDAIKPYHT
ncbi:extended synaptotagmin-1-like [Periplaneta americana]|uniref:extended synaptotagmin-1-like n=1 Tax=Periplaneta americana TaxID=6978 RepID=UPI0037E7A97B